MTGVLFFDGACGMCTRSVNFLMEHNRAGDLEIAPLQSPGVAERLGIPNARRAVGRANGTNMLSIIIPCHRVIRADGSLCGYGGGLWRKKWLLDHERKHKKVTSDSDERDLIR